MKDVMNVIDKEISTSLKNEKPIYIQLFRDENVFKGIFTQKIEGEFILSCKDIEGDIPVQVKWDKGLITITGLDTELNALNAFLLKDSASILRAVKEKISREELPVKPSFLIGPPGTGKSTVIVETVKKSIKNQRILILSPTHMAVENVFERLDLPSLGLADDEIVININTENESLRLYNSEYLYENKKLQFADEQEVLKSAKDELLQKRRVLEPLIQKFDATLEQNQILSKNLTSELSHLGDKIKKEEKVLKDLEKRLELINSNSILNNIASIFSNGSSNKKMELESLISMSKKMITQYNEKLNKIKNDIVSIDTMPHSTHLKDKKELNLINESIKKISDRLKEIDFELVEITSGNPYKKARLVGATLVSAATNKKLQLAEFDKILIDESSMALYPYILSASQCLSTNEIEIIKIQSNPKLTKSQNEGVELLVNNKIGLIGDPRQLTAIAMTTEMKQTVFDIYNIDRLFDGEKVENTVLLDTNFRNHPDIVNLASKLFYGGLLKPGKKENGLKSVYMLNLKSNMCPSNGSYINKGNCDLVIEQVTKALKKGRRSIGIVTPYKEQAKLINKHLDILRKSYPDADIQSGTIHKFQGKERDIIIFDLCFAPTSEDNIVPKAYEGSFKSETAKLLNVAMTRAESFFILIGDIKGIKEMKASNLILKDWINEIEAL